MRRVGGEPGRAMGAHMSVSAVSAEIVGGTLPTRPGEPAMTLRAACVGGEVPGRALKGVGGRLQGRERRAGWRAHTLVIFDRHAKLPIASGSVPLTTGPAVPQSM